MKDTLKMLVELQGIDESLQEWRKAKERLVRIKADNAKAIEMFDSMLAESQGQIDETQRFYRERELQLQENEAQIGRSKGRLNAITNQRELNALTKELENLRKANTQRQQELVELLEQVEAAQQVHNGRVQEKETLVGRMGEAEETLANRVTDLEARSGDLTSRREGLRGQLERGLLSRYDRIAKARQGQAVADVQGGTCGACNVQTPPQQFIRLQRMETMESCSSCKRILIWFEGITGIPSAPAEEAEA